jgi:hypothetical protein
MQETSARNLASQAPHTTEGGKHSMVEIFGRAGYASKGAVYVIIGGLALMQVLGIGQGDATGSQGALVALDQQPYGNILLYLMAAGLVMYTLWRVAQGIFDVENKGSDGIDVVKRAGLVISGGLYGYLAIAAIQLAHGASQPGGEESSQKASEAMSVPGGTWLVIAVGVGFIATGLYQAWRAYALDFTKHWKGSLSGDQRRWATRISRFGIAARAVIFVIMGGFIAQAGINADPGQTRGFEQVMQSFSDKPWLLGSIAVGLICYAIYSWVNAWFRQIPANSTS